MSASAAMAQSPLLARLRRDTREPKRENPPSAYPAVTCVGVERADLLIYWRARHDSNV